MPDLPRTDRDGSADLVNVPNVITFARLCSVPLAIWTTLQHRLDDTFFIFVAAGLSDAVDGWLARRRGGTAVGAVLDPVADKALLVSMYVTLAAVSILPDWLAIMVVFRDALIVGGVLVLAVLGQPAQIRPLIISKINTALQILLVALALLLSGFHLQAPVLLATLVWAVAVSTLASGSLYVWKAARSR
ncbi:MAG: CDP-alcohol phosphatidyltransferase family protein [Acetobacteraceae bacterium]|nr:CDP-alcohol phosphatidyltransferase family protein [Acetobacteraceae bacterium]